MSGYLNTFHLLTHLNPRKGKENFFLLRKALDALYSIKTLVKFRLTKDEVFSWLFVL